MSNFIRLKEYPKAITQYTSLLLENPSNTKWLINRALAYFHNHEYLKSIHDCKDILKIEKYHTKAHWRLGRCYEITQQWELAWKAYLKIYNIREAKEKILSLRPFIMGSHFINVEQSLNISNPNFCVTNFEHERGLMACRYIRKNNIILSIHIDKLITETSGRNTTWGKIFKSHESNIQDEFLVYLVFSLIHRLIQTPNDPYMLTMPNNTLSMPFFWTQEQLSVLGSSYIQDQIKERKQNAIDIYNILEKNIPDILNSTSQDRFLYLMSLVSTRNFTVKVGDSLERLMVPFADMMNHHEQPNTKWFFNNDINSFQMDATQDIELGDMLYDSYGDRDNAVLMSVYGFSLPMNKFDRVRIMPSVFLYRDGAITNKQFNTFRKHFTGTPQDIERSLLKYIRGRIEILQYPTTLEQDEEWLKTNEKYTPEYFIRLALVSEKHILKEWTTIIDECLGTPTKRQRRKWKSGTNERIYLKLIWSKFK